jgi:hypothetical protein
MNPTEIPPDVLDWLLDSDPSMRWQVLRDLTDASEEEIAQERARMTAQGAAARLLALQTPDGLWSGTAWNHGWDSTMHALTLLREMGLDPGSPEARSAVGRVRDQVTWKDCGPEETQANAFFDGETEPCINGQVAAAGAYFGQDVGGLIRRLLAEQLPDGGWNCEAESGSIRSSFNTSLCVLEALLEWELSGRGGPEVIQARERGQEYLLERRLLRRKSTGEVIERDRRGGLSWSHLAFPNWWRYDVLRGLDFLRRAGATPDPRAGEAVAVIASKRGADGRWIADISLPGRMLVEIGDGAGKPDRGITLRDLRVLAWSAGIEQGRTPTLPQIPLEGSQGQALRVRSME